MQTFADATDPATFGNMTAVQATANVAELPPLDPTVDSYVWTVELTSSTPGVLPRTAGPMAATEVAEFGVVSSAVPWQVTGRVARQSAPGSVVSTSQSAVAVTGLVTNVDLAFT